MPREGSPQRNHTFLARYGATILRGGIASIPSALYRYQGELKLPVQHVWFISAILAHKWDTDLPEPSLKQMARRTGVSEQQLHNYKRKLVEDGWLLIVTQHNRRGGQEANAYDFSPLLGQLEELLTRDKPSAGEQSADPEQGGLNHSLAGGLKPNLAGGLNQALALKESVDQESLDREAALISNKTNSSVFHSNDADGEFSTSVREQRIVDNAAGADPPGNETDQPRPSTGWEKLVREAKKLRSPLPDQEARVEPIAPAAPRGRPPKAPDYLKAVMEDVSFKLHDEQPRSSLTRATKLWKTTGLPEDKFVQRLYEAQSITRQQGTVTKRASGDHGAINRMPYFFAVVEDRLGLKDHAVHPT